jgi:hypothetical protein
MKEEVQQTYENHRRVYPVHHFVFLPLSLITLIAAVVYVVRSVNEGSDWLPALIILGLAFMMFMLGFIARRNGLVAQDRVIRAEEQWRHYMLTQNPLDSRLTVSQLIALRFASDEEFPQLAARAAEKQMKPNEIKKAIQQWRPDTHRV